MVFLENIFHYKRINIFFNTKPHITYCNMQHAFTFFVCSRKRERMFFANIGVLDINNDVDFI
jgi:hypothetical protein